MSLLYIVDAYNLINHQAFKPSLKSVNIQQALADFIKSNNLTGSKNNRVILVFDGYPAQAATIPEEVNLVCMFSKKIEADESIKRIIENSSSPKNIVVVTDDKEVQLISRFLHANVCSVEEFISSKPNKNQAFTKKYDLDDPKLSYTKIQKINAELIKKWLV